ncbi:hypothetical protein [Budvicia aquatica]
MSNPTSGRIHGRLPTVTGDIQILNPGGTTVVTNNQVVNENAKPSQFTASTNYSGLTVTDLDGDTGLSWTVNTAGVALSWKHGATILSSGQLNQPFSPGWEGETLTVSAVAPTTVSSITGIPRSGSGPVSGTAVYSVKVPPITWLYRVNGVTFNANQGFPTTGFIGAKYQILAGADTNNSNYTWTVSPPVSWITVDNNGLVTYTGTPPSSDWSYTIQIRNRISGTIRTISTNTLQKWHTFRIGASMTQGKAIDYCTSLGSGYRLPTYYDLLNGRPRVTNGQSEQPVSRTAPGPLWSEWGNISAYISNIDYITWTRTVTDSLSTTGTNFASVNFSAGTYKSVWSPDNKNSASDNNPSHPWQTVSCVKSI